MTFKLKLEIECGNAAFGDSRTDRYLEVARILHETAEKMQRDIATPRALRDLNGNVVGTVEFIDDGR